MFENLPLAYRFAILVASAVVGLGIVGYLISGLLPKRIAPAPVTSLSSTWNIRRLIISIAGGLAVAQVIVLTLTFAGAGAGIAQLMARLSGAGQLQAETAASTGALVGILVGFIFSAVWMAFIFTLAEIERNTRHTAAVLDRLVSHMQR